MTSLFSFFRYKVKTQKWQCNLTLFGVGKTVLILEPERGLDQIIDVVEGKVLSSRPQRVLLGIYQHRSGSGRWQWACKMKCVRVYFSWQRPNG